MANESESGRRPRKTRVWIWVPALGLVGGLTVFLWSCDIALFPQKLNSTVLVLDNCDPDFKAPPFDDAVITFGSNGAASRIATHLNLAQTVGGTRSLSVSHDGRFFVVCENVGKRLTAYETQTGKRLWSVDGEFTSATVAQNGAVYAIISDGTIYGKRTVVIDDRGGISKGADTAGFDIALDEKRQTLWLVGKTIKRCDLELKVLGEINPIKWCAVSVDVNPDGSIWVAEREHPNVAQSTNRILKISSSGQILKAVNLEWSPFCLRVDHSDGSVWVTGVGFGKSTTGRILDSIERRTGALPTGKKLRDFLTRSRLRPRTQKHDAEGNLLGTINEGGHSIDLQQSDGSVWLAGASKIYHYSRAGRKLAKLGGVSSDQKYIVVSPDRRAEPKTAPNAR